VDVAGYFQSGRDVNYITLTTETMAEDPYRTIFHEYVHLLVNNTMGRAGVPPWFNEGLAEYYSTFEIQDARKATLGKPISNHIHFLRSTKLWPLKTLFSVDYHSLERNKHEARGVFYAQSWALVHYLIQGDDGKRKDELGKFLEMLVAGTPVETAFRDTFQMDYATLEKQLKSYIQRETYRINIATFTKKLEFDSEMTVSPLTEAQGQAYLGDLLYHTQRGADAITRLNQALTLDPNLGMAHASLGMVLMEQKQFDQAKEHLAKAVATGSADYLSHYYYAFVLSREGMDQNNFVSSYPAEIMQTMRDHLQRAIVLKADFAESYHLLGFISLVNSEDLDKAAELIQKAIALSPGSEEYLFVLAQIYLRQENNLGAKRVLEPLAATSSDPRIRVSAENFLKSILSVEEQIAEGAKRKEEVLKNAEARKASTESVNFTSEQMAITNPHSYLEEALRQPTEGESRLQGLLTRVDCGANGIVFTVQVGEQGMKFVSTSFEDVDITTFITSVGGELTCGPRKGAEAVVITYTATKDRRSNTDGVAVAIEFVPSDFKLTGK
jgi:tetratricopeptide (TPR) repeat protein